MSTYISFLRQINEVGNNVTCTKPKKYMDQFCRKFSSHYSHLSKLAVGFILR